MLTTRNANNDVVVRQGQERINDLNSVLQDREYILTRNNNNELRVAETQERIQNIGDIVENQNFVLTRNANNDLIVQIANESIPINDIQENTNYENSNNEKR